MRADPPAGEEQFYVYLIEQNPFQGFDFKECEGELLVGKIDDVVRRYSKIKSVEEVPGLSRPRPPRGGRTGRGNRRMDSRRGIRTNCAVKATRFGACGSKGRPKNKFPVWTYMKETIRKKWRYLGSRTLCGLSLSLRYEPCWQAQLKQPRQPSSPRQESRLPRAVAVRFNWNVQTGNLFFGRRQGNIT